VREFRKASNKPGSSAKNRLDGESRTLGRPIRRQLQ